ncbi:MAG: flagellar hook capping protein [Desulfobacterales bacterium]|nr:flagellar hook capping protein [Desulfobacterales bacterium]
MSVSSTGNRSLDHITSSYQSNDKEEAEKNDALGQDAFLTMLVAQLQNQDPLNPMDGTDFSAQLAEFSQLEQLMNLNETMESLTSTLSENSDEDAVSYIGKQITGNVDVMNVEEGTVSGGFYNLSQPADVMINITDANGNTVKTLYPGQMSAGSHLIKWDGTDNNRDAVEDGTYKYTVMANSGRGFEEIPATITGKVDGVAYNNGTSYLVVQGILVDTQSLLSVVDLEQDQPDSVDSVMAYLGRTISSDAPIVLVEDDAVSGGDLTFNLDKQEGVTIEIYNATDDLIRTIKLEAEDTSGGENSYEWDGMAAPSPNNPNETNENYRATDGLYYYIVKTDSGEFIKTPVSEEVSGIKTVHGTQYLVLSESGRLVAPSKVTEIY